MITAQQRIQSPQGICTSIVLTDEANAEVIKTVLSNWIQHQRMQRARRATADWQDCIDMPMDFSDYLYRLPQWG